MQPLMLAGLQCRELELQAVCAAADAAWRVLGAARFEGQLCMQVAQTAQSHAACWAAGSQSGLP